MSLDPYQPCPCGGGKKLKFCCCKDILHDLEKVLDTLDSDQRAASLHQLDKLIAAKGERSALLALKADVQLELGELDDAQATIERLLAQESDNPVALAQSAVLLAIKGEDEVVAITKLQRAIEAVDEELPMAIYTAFGVLGRVLLARGNILAARSHLMVRAALDEGEDTTAMQLLMRIHSAPEVPLLLKQDMRFAKRPDDVPWAEQFDEAMQVANRGAWLSAAEKLTMLAFRARRQPSIHKNIAILRSWLGDTKATVTAWRSYAERDDVPLDEAAEAEALAQLLDPLRQQDKLDVVTITYPVNDSEKLMERFASDRRVAKMPVDLAQLAGDDDQPPPKGAFWLLDKELPASAEGLTRESIPCVRGEMFVFGKQTDRDARLEFTAPKTDDFSDKAAAIANLLEDLGGESHTEEVTDAIDRVSAALTWRWHLPKDTPHDLRERLVVDQREDVILNKWPDLSLGVLDGKTPNEVAADPAYRVRLLAAILLLELAGLAQNVPEMDYNKLRRKLNLPTRDPIDPTQVDVTQLSLVRLAQVEVEKLTDDDLVKTYHRAGQLGAVSALRSLAEEVVRRGNLDGVVDKTEAYEILARLTRDNDRALDYIAKARETAVARGESPAPWLIGELTLRLERGKPDQIPELIRTIQRKYINEPGVAQALYETLLRFGIINSDGTPAGPRSQAAPAAAPAPTAPAPGKIWTPDSAAASAAGEQKSKLWVPGID